jgi:outer membrane protein assembly factor BamA
MKKLVFIISLIFISPTLWGQEKNKDDKNFDFKPVPYLNYSRTGGFAFGAITMAMYRVDKNDTISPESISGLIGAYTTEGNWIAMFFQKFYLKEDTWRVTAAGGIGFVGFQFYLDGLGDFINYSTNARFIMAKGERKLLNKIYAGLRIARGITETSFENLPSAKETIYNNLGLSLSNDLRNDVYYPTHGSISELMYSFNPEWLKNEFVSQKLEIEYNKYIPVKNSDVLAFRGKLGLGIGDVAFEQQFIIGNEDIRGYTQGEYRGNNLAAIQGEYRWNFQERLGLVGFFGIATIWDGINQDDNGKLLPGIGAGFRFNVFPENHMNIGLDAAAGNGDWGIYFRIGEAF